MDEFKIKHFEYSNITKDILYTQGYGDYIFHSTGRLDIYIPGDDTITKSGTGILVGPQFVLTNLSMAIELDEIVVQFTPLDDKNQKCYTILDVKEILDPTDQTKGLAVLKLNKPIGLKYGWSPIVSIDDEISFDFFKYLGPLGVAIIPFYEENPKINHFFFEEPTPFAENTPLETHNIVNIHKRQLSAFKQSGLNDGVIWAKCGSPLSSEIPYHVVGVVDNNKATRITHHIFKEIVSYMIYNWPKNIDFDFKHQVDYSYEKRECFDWRNRARNAKSLHRQIYLSNTIKTSKIIKRNDLINYAKLLHQKYTMSPSINEYVIYECINIHLRKLKSPERTNNNNNNNNNVSNDNEIYGLLDKSKQWNAMVEYVSNYNPNQKTYSSNLLSSSNNSILYEQNNVSPPPTQFSPSNGDLVLLDKTRQFIQTSTLPILSTSQKNINFPLLTSQ